MTFAWTDTTVRQRQLLALLKRPENEDPGLGMELRELAAFREADWRPLFRAGLMTGVYGKLNTLWIGLTETGMELVEAGNPR